MTDRRRIALRLALASLLVLVVALPVIATEGSTEPTGEVATEGTEESGAETVEPQDPIVTDIDSVVVVTVPTNEVVTADWTYRYLVPTGILLIVIVILITTARYFTNVVRKRYRIVEE